MDVGEFTLTKFHNCIDWLLTEHVRNDVHPLLFDLLLRANNAANANSAAVLVGLAAGMHAYERVIVERNWQVLYGELLNVCTMVNTRDAIHDISAVYEAANDEQRDKMWRYAELFANCARQLNGQATINFH